MYLVVYDFKRRIPADGRDVPSQVRNDYEQEVTETHCRELKDEEALRRWMREYDDKFVHRRIYKAQEVEVRLDLNIIPIEEEKESPF